MNDSVRAFVQWVEATREEAGRRLPHLLMLDGPDLGRELASHPEWQPGVTHVLLEHIAPVLRRDPSRAHELTAVVVEHAARGVPLRYAWCAPTAQTHAWIDHARALNALGRYAEAYDALATAYDIGRHAGVMQPWLDAKTRIAEAESLHGLGRSEDALSRIPAAAELFALAGDDQAYAGATLLEAQIHCDTGGLWAAEAVWTRARDAAWEESLERLAWLDRDHGAYLLQRGDAAGAARAYATAQELFRDFDRTREATAALCGRADCAAALGEVDKALRLYRGVQTKLMAGSEPIEAALVATDILTLLVTHDRGDQAAAFAEPLVRQFARAGLSLNALHAWAYVQHRAGAFALTPEELRPVRRYFERLPLRPNAAFPPNPPA